MEGNNQRMPSVGGHLTMVIFGFIFGVLWGALSIAPFTRMKNAVNEGDSETAWQNAKKVKLFFFIGLGVNILFIIIRVIAANA